MAKTKEEPQLDPLDELEKADAHTVIALMLWKERHRYPDLSIQITSEDIAEFEACANYLEVKPVVQITRPRGRPATPALPPSRVHPQGYPAQPAEPPRNFVFVGVGYFEKNGIFNSIKPIESTEDGADKRDSANRGRVIRERGPQLARELMSNAAAGTFSSSMVEEAAQMLNDAARLIP
jgi:hypothetical protein